MSKFNSPGDLEEFSRRYLKPLLLDALQARLQAWPVALTLPAGAIVDACDRESWQSDFAEDGPMFVRTQRGWAWRDHALLAWRTDGAVKHERISELEHRYDVIVSEQPDMAGILRPTADLHAVQMRYERDAVPAPVDLGTGWARLTLRWSLRLQLVVTAAGRANVIARATRVPPRADAGRSGPYISADPLAHLIDAGRLARDWDRGAAGLAAVQDQLVSRLAAAIETPLAHSAPPAYI